MQSVSTADATLTLELQPRANLKSKFGKFFPREFLFFLLGKAVSLCFVKHLHYFVLAMV